MKSFIQSAVSLLEQGIEACHLSETNHPCDVIVPGYTPLLTEYQQAPLPESYDRHPVGIFYADIADFSHLTEQDEEVTHHRLIESMNIMQPHVAANNGRVVHLADDAVLAEFKDPDSTLH